MMRTDNQIYQELGQILFNISPDDAIKTFLKTKLSPENDVCDFEFDYINKLNQEKWFIPEFTRISSQIKKLVVELRKFYLENNLNNDQQIWNTAHMSLDIATGKFDIEFEFDEVFEHEGEEFEE